MLLRYDHHVVRVHGRAALLRTYHLAEDTTLQEPTVEISFTYARGHPPAPPEVQMIVETLGFEPVAG